MFCLCSRLLVRCFKRAPYIFLASNDSLNRLVQENITVKEFRKETTTGKLACPEIREDKIKATEAKMHDLCSQYVTTLTDNIDQRFQHSLPVVLSFRIFDQLSVPIGRSEVARGIGSSWVSRGVMGLFWGTPFA